MIKTLRSLVAEHPEWVDLPLTVCRSDGELDYVGAAGAVDLGVGENHELVVIFSAN